MAHSSESPPDASRKRNPSSRTPITGLPPTKASALACCLCRMARPAQRLPVQLVPEQHGIAFMRHDVVHALGGHQPALALALRAERMLTTVGDARPVPANAVATLASIPSTLVGLLLPLALVLLASAAL